MHDTHILVEVSHRRSKLVGVPSGEIRPQALAVGTDEVEKGAAAIERGEGEGGKIGNVDGDEREDVFVGEAAPQRDFVFELGLEALIVGFAFADQLAADDLDSTFDTLVAGQSVGLPDDAETAKADFFAQHIVTYFLAFAVGFAGLFVALPPGEVCSGGGDGGVGRAPGPGGLTTSEIVSPVNGVGETFCPAT